MAWGAPPARKRRAATSRAAARAKDRPTKRRDPQSVPAPGEGPRVVSSVAQAASGDGIPTNVLGSLGGHKGDHRLPGTSQINEGTPEAAAIGWGADRVGKRFTVGFTQDGRVVHLYGGDVPAAQRRVVLNRR